MISTRHYAKAAASAALLLTLSACAETVTVKGQPACPPSFRAWPPAFQTRIADGLKALPPGENSAAVREAVRQAVNMRSELRAGGCQEQPAVLTTFPEFANGE